MYLHLRLQISSNTSNLLLVNPFTPLFSNHQAGRMKPQPSTSSRKRARQSLYITTPHSAADNQLQAQVGRDG